MLSIMTAGAQIELLIHPSSAQQYKADLTLVLIPTPRDKVEKCVARKGFGISS